MSHTFASLYNFACASSCDFCSCVACAYLGAFGHGGGRLLGHVHCKINDCLCLQVHLSPLSPLVLGKETCLSTRCAQKPLRAGGACHMHTSIPCGLFMIPHVFSCLKFYVHASWHASGLFDSLSENHRFWWFAESEAGDPGSYFDYCLACTHHSLCHVPCACSMSCRARAFCARTCVHTRTHMYTHAHTHAGAHAQLHAGMSAHTRTCTCAEIRIHTSRTHVHL